MDGEAVGAIADASASAAAAEVEAGEARADADEALTKAEQVENSLEGQWTMTQEMFSGLRESVETLRAQVADLATPPTPDQDEGIEVEGKAKAETSEPPSLGMSVAEPKETKATGGKVRKGTRAIKFW